jgi:hypothetical protein
MRSWRRGDVGRAVAWWLWLCLRIGAWDGSNGESRETDDAVKMHSYRFWNKFGEKRV